MPRLPESKQIYILIRMGYAPLSQQVPGSL